MLHTMYYFKKIKILPSFIPSRISFVIPDVGVEIKAAQFGIIGPRAKVYHAKESDVRVPKTLRRFWGVDL